MAVGRNFELVSVLCSSSQSGGGGGGGTGHRNLLSTQYFL